MALLGELMRKRLVEALRLIEKENSAVDAIDCVDSCCVYMNNIIQFPLDKKFRKVRRSNLAYVERVGSIVGGEALLESVGFLVDGDFLVMESELHAEEQYTLRSLRKICWDKLEELDLAFNDVPHYPSDYKWKAVRGAAIHGDIGRRNAMEDDHVLVDQFSGSRDLAYFGLYDGHGGRNAVEFVVKTLHTNLESIFKSGIPDQDEIMMGFNDAYIKTDDQMRRKNIWESGTTCVSCLFHRSSPTQTFIYTANVGDSRAVLCRNGKSFRLSRDHKPSDDDEAKRIVESGGFIGRSNRVNGVLSVSRALGDHMFKPYVSPVPHITATRVNSEDLFIILACDGLWDVCSDQDAVDFVLEQARECLFLEKLDKHPRNPPTADISIAELIEDAESRQRIVRELPKFCEGLVRLALNRNSSDNVSVMIVWL